MADDPLARGLAIAGLVVALASLVLTWYLWYRSGPGLSVSATVSALTGQVVITVICTGRMATRVKSVELRDWLIVSNGQTKPTVVSRWVLPVTQVAVVLEPNESFQASVDVSRVLQMAPGFSEVTVWAGALRGDGKWSGTKPFVVR